MKNKQIKVGDLFVNEYTGTYFVVLEVYKEECLVYNLSFKERYYNHVIALNNTLLCRKLT